MTDDRLQGRVALVIGAGSSGPGWGNGKACAVAYARAGAKVVAADIDLSAALETADLIRQEQGTALAVAADAKSASDLKQVVAIGTERFGRIDILHYNVGIVVRGGCLELAEEAWRHAFDINVTGCFLACKAVLPLMEQQGRAIILTTGSIAGIGFSGSANIAYYTTKAALIQLTRAIAIEFAGSGIRAVSILPGLMDTPMIRNSGLGVAESGGDEARLLELRASRCPTGKMGDAWDVANAAVFLASDQAKYITATELVVDGGITARFG